MTTPRLSIGLPVYNGEEYLAESLDALLGQSYEDFELIISDNASADGTEEICRLYQAKDPRIRYIRLPKNIGAAPNHNFAFQVAKGGKKMPGSSGNGTCDLSTSKSVARKRSSRSRLRSFCFCKLYLAST